MKGSLNRLRDGENRISVVDYHIVLRVKIFSLKLEKPYRSCIKLPYAFFDCTDTVQVIEADRSCVIN